MYGSNINLALRYYQVQSSPLLLFRNVHLWAGFGIWSVKAKRTVSVCMEEISCINVPGTSSQSSWISSMFIHPVNMIQQVLKEKRNCPGDDKLHLWACSIVCLQQSQSATGQESSAVRTASVSTAARCVTMWRTARTGPMSPWKSAVGGPRAHARTHNTGDYTPSSHLMHTHECTEHVSIK